MIHLFYTRFRSQLLPCTFNYYLRQLPHSLQLKILRYRNWQDAQRSLLGKALLAKGLGYIGLSDHSLANLVCTGLDRPYFMNSEIDFNISHSGEYIVCGISTTGKIGVDIEEIKEVPFEDFTDNFTESEWRNIENGKTKIAGFYDYWTKKEAFLKAIGMGLNVPLNQIEILDNKIMWENKEWFLHEVAIDGRYVSHYSTLEAVPKFQLHQLFFE